jgi:hypothetical protein
MKKLLSVLFASMVIFSLAMPVFADDATATTATTKAKKTKAAKAAKTKKTKATTDTKTAQ